MYLSIVDGSKGNDLLFSRQLLLHPVSREFRVVFVLVGYMLCILKFMYEKHVCTVSYHDVLRRRSIAILVPASHTASSHLSSPATTVIIPAQSCKSSPLPPTICGLVVVGPGIRILFLHAVVSSIAHSGAFEAVLGRLLLFA